jgi:hypothetical protein
MKKIFGILSLLYLLFAGCNTPPPIDPKKLNADSIPFYPINDFFKNQIQYVNLRNYAMYMVKNKNGKRDSSNLSKEGFIALSKTFVDSTFSSPAFNKQYKESIYHDLSTKSYTLNYSPVDHKATIQNMYVLLDEETHQVKRIFIRSVYSQNDTLITEQRNWKAFKSFQINRSKQTNNGWNTTEFIFVNWNDKP